MAMTMKPPKAVLFIWLGIGFKSILQWNMIDQWNMTISDALQE